MGFVPILGVACELYRTPFFFILSCLIFKSKRRPWNSKLGQPTIWPGNFPLVDQHASQAVRQGGRAPSIRVPFRVQS